MTYEVLTPVGAEAGAASLRMFEGRAMGSPLRLTLPAAEPEARLVRAWTVVRDEFETSETAFSRFRLTSEMTALNRSVFDGLPRPVSRRLRQALATCDRACRLTGGQFDPRVLWDLERLGDSGASIDPPVAGQPSPTRSDGARIVAWDGRGRARLDRPVDLGGIGKGLALRWASDAVRRLGFGAFLLDAGGDLVTAGRPPEGGSWRVGIEDPSGSDGPLAVIESAGEAVATSSIRLRRWETAGRVVHHLIDPRTGEPGGAGLLAATVAGRDPAWAEVWSKTLFLEGVAGIAALARQRGLGAWWVLEDGSLAMTPAARVRTTWVRDELG